MARILRAVLAATVATGLAVPALAHEHHQEAAQANWQSGYPAAYQNPYQGSYPNGSAPYSQPSWQGANGQPMPQPVYNGAPPPNPAEADPRYREMLDRCQGVTRRNSGTTGAVIGGLVGGVIGNRVASGNRTLGTVAGAAVGAVTGGVIGKSVDRSRERECEEFFSSYAPAPGYGQPQAGYPGAYPGYGYPAYGYMMVPVMMVQTPQQPCTETRTETVTYVRERIRHHYVARHPVYRVKRIKEKRVYTGS